MSAHGAPVRSRQKMPFNTRRSSTRFTPRPLFGNNGAITDHSKSARSNRAIQTSSLGKLESLFAKKRNPLYGYVTYATRKCLSARPLTRASAPSPPPATAANEGTRSLHCVDSVQPTHCLNTSFHED